MCPLVSQMTSWPGRVCAIKHVRLPIDPDGTKSPASRPNSNAARACSMLTVGSSRNTSSPTSASAIARRMAAEGRVTVSERKSIVGMKPYDGREGRRLSRLNGWLPSGDSGELAHDDPRGLVVIALMPPEAALDPPAVLSLIVEQRAASAAHV